VADGNLIAPLNEKERDQVSRTAPGRSTTKSQDRNGTS